MIGDLKIYNSQVYVSDQLKLKIRKQNGGQRGLFIIQ